MTTSSSSEEKTPEIKCGNGVMSISNLTANYPVIPREELEVREQLGAGTYGSVFKGIWRIKKANEPVVVALKKVFMLEREVDILSQVRHRNIIQFFGVSQANPDFYIVTEYAENGSLFEYLHNKKVDLFFEQILKLAIQVAHGVAYLHYEAPTTIIHRDLKSRNVVLGKKMVCKICDFGTSKDLTHSYTAPTWGGTAAWMSPEIINQREGITTATDVWSYGVLLWEMFSREIPYKGLTDFKIYSITSLEGCQLLLPDTCPTHLSDLLKKCWYKNPKERTDMRSIIACLEAINVDKRVHRECVHFVKQKKSWHKKIEEQLNKINEMELDFERRCEELKKWEQILRRRESSHRNFLHVIDLMNTTDVAEWDADCVCEWVQYMAAGQDISEQVIDKIIGRILQHEIRGSRLLQVTERDLENLGIEPAAVRNHIVEKVAELNLLRPIKNTVTSSPKSGSPQDDYLNFPPLNLSAELEARNKQNKTAFSHPINLIVGMYSQLIVGGEGRKCRFKIFLDSDWEALSAVNEISSEIRDSTTVIKDVFMSITNLTDNTVLLESVRCVCPPFGYLEWTEIDLETAPRISVTLAVTYTDQIIQPRNTRIAVEVQDFSSMSRILSSKMVSLKIRPFPTNTSLSRISSTMACSQSPSDSANLQGVWRARRSSMDNSFGRDSPRMFGSSEVVNEIIPISSVSIISPDIAEIHRRYQQRFARRGGGVVGQSLQKAASPKSPLADNTNSRGLFAAVSKTAPRLQSEQRSTSVSLTPSKTLSTIARRGPSLTVLLSDKANAARQLATQVLRLQKMPLKEGSGAKFQRWRTKSETEASAEQKTNDEVSSGDKGVLCSHPKFYVCDDDSPGGGLVEPPLPLGTAVNSNGADGGRLEWRLPRTPSSDRSVVSVMERKSSNLENESPDDFLPSVENGVASSSLANAGDCKGSCQCRLRRAIFPDVIDDDSPLKCDVTNGHSSEEFDDRKYRPKANGTRKYKKSASKSKLNNNAQLLSGDANNLKYEENEERPNITNGLPNPDKQNMISRQVYGGYDKWRWK